MTVHHCSHISLIISFINQFKNFDLKSCVKFFVVASLHGMDERIDNESKWPFTKFIINCQWQTASMFRKKSKPSRLGMEGIKSQYFYGIFRCNHGLNDCNFSLNFMWLVLTIEKGQDTYAKNADIFRQIGVTKPIPTQF